MALVAFYFLALAVALIIMLLGSLLYSILTGCPFLEAFRWAMIFGSIILMVFGCLGGFAHHYSSTRARVIHSLSSREVIKHTSRGRESEDIGIILVALGLTLFIMYIAIFS